MVIYCNQHNWFNYKYFLHESMRYVRTLLSNLILRKKLTLCKLFTQNNDVKTNNPEITSNFNQNKSLILFRHLKPPYR